MKPSLAVCAMIRNESSGIEEWIHHYLARDVSHFFIIDDASDDGCYEMLKKHESLGYLTLLNPAIPKIPHRQYKAYNEFIKPLINSFDWIAILDADEFLWSSESLSLTDYLSNVSAEISMVKVLMSDFGDNGLTAQPSNIVNSFTKRSKDIQKPSEHHFKSIFRSSCLRSMKIHVSDVSGNCVIDNDRLRLNHYKLQSLERWLNVIVPRGSANFTREGGCRHTERYFKFHSNRMNAIEDFGLINQNNQIS